MYLIWTLATCKVGLRLGEAAPKKQTVVLQCACANKEHADSRNKRQRKELIVLLLLNESIKKVKKRHFFSLVLDRVGRIWKQGGAT